MNTEEEVKIVPWSEVRARLRVLVYADGNARAFAQKHGIHESALSMIMAGKRVCPGWLLNMVGVERTEVLAEVPKP